jgi:hypothetical protein
MDANARPDERSDDFGLQVGKRKDQIRFESEDFRDIGGDEGRDARFLLACMGRTDGVAGNADDAMLFTEQIKCFGGFLRQADDPLRRMHRGARIFCWF